MQDAKSAHRAHSLQETGRSKTPQTWIVSALGVIASLIGALDARASDVLYDVDFETPPHVLGSTPTTGDGPAPRETISSVVFGAPTVVLGYESLGQQPLLFDSSDQAADQIRLDLSNLPASDHYCIEADLLISAQAGTDTGFTILHDTPQVRNIRFENGEIRTFVPFIGGSLIGTYTRGDVIQVRSEIDFPTDLWTISIDGSVAFTGSFGGATALTSLRFSTGTVGDVGVVAALDNVHVFTGTCTSIETSPTIYFSPTSTIDAGGVSVDNEDVARRIGGAYELVFDGSAFGLASENVDALQVLANGSLLLSFSSGATLPGLGPVEDEDIVRFDPDPTNPVTAGTFSLFFEGDAEGLSGSSLDLDAISVQP